MVRILLGGVMFAVGILATLQPPINAALARRTGALPATTVSFVVGSICLLAFSLVLGGGGGFGEIRHAPRWQLTGGLIGAVFVFSTVVLIPRLGATGLVAAMVAGQLTGGMIVDRLGLFGLPVIALSPARLAGLVLLVIGGVLVVQR